jgi:hypothetical protein
MNKADKIPTFTPEEFQNGKAGYIYAPYTIKTVKTTVNGVTVWHNNKLINFWLKIKFFFCKPKTLKNFEAYAAKPINVKYYKTILINKNEQPR